MKPAHRLPVLPDDPDVLPELTDQQLRAQKPRPRTRGEWLSGGINAARLCPWVSCRHHLALDVSQMSGNIREYGDPARMAATCSLDLAHRAALGEDVTLDEIGQVVHVTRERIRQLEAAALRKLATHRGEQVRRLREMSEP